MSLKITHFIQLSACKLSEREDNNNFSLFWFRVLFPRHVLLAPSRWPAQSQLVELTYLGLHDHYGELWKRNVLSTAIKIAKVPFSCVNNSLAAISHLIQYSRELQSCGKVTSIPRAADPHTLRRATSESVAVLCAVRRHNSQLTQPVVLCNSWPTATATACSYNTICIITSLVTSR